MVRHRAPIDAGARASHHCAQHAIKDATTSSPLPHLVILAVVVVTLHLICELGVDREGGLRGLPQRLRIRHVFCWCTLGTPRSPSPALTVKGGDAQPDTGGEALKASEGNAP